MKRKDISSNSKALKHLNLVQMENKIMWLCCYRFKNKSRGVGVGGVDKETDMS